MHTLAESDSPTALPKKAVKSWKFEGIYCREGHELKAPSEVKDWTVTTEG